MAIVKCPYCAEDIQDAAILCKHCGKPLVAPTGGSVNSVNESLVQQNIPQKSPEPQIERNTAAFVMALIGGVFGIIAGISAITIGGIGAAFGAKEGHQIGSLGVSAIFFSLWAIVGSVIVRRHVKIGGMFLIAATIGGFISVSAFYILPGILIGIAGIMGLTKKPPVGVSTKYSLWVPITIVIFGLLMAMGLSSKPTASLNEESKGNFVQGVQGSGDTLYFVGDPVALSDHTIVINSYQQGFQSDNMFDRPGSSDKEFVVINVTTKNTGSDSISVNMFGFELEDDAGVKRNPTIVAGLDNNLESVDLQPGGNITGNLAFEARKDSKTLMLHYSGNINSGKVKIQLK